MFQVGDIIMFTGQSFVEEKHCYRLVVEVHKNKRFRVVYLTTMAHSFPGLALSNYRLVSTIFRGEF